MPIFEYRCRSCGHAFEELVGRADEKVPCPQCRAETDKLFSSFATATAGGTNPCGSSACPAPGGG
jgi:putative FmdB family regulatory protein